MSDYNLQESQQEMDQFTAQIEAEQQKINDAYTQIGKAYYESHSTDYDPEYESFYSAIRASYETVVSLREKILEAKGLRICPNCGCEMSLAIRFCSECGTLMADESPEEPRCKRCGEPLAEGAKFCTKCGQPTDVPSQAPVFADSEPITEYVSEEPEEAPATDITPEPAEEPFEESAEEPTPAQNICPVCGEPLFPGSAFCTSCGARIDTTPEPEISEPLRPAFCTGCGSPLTPGVAFCTECGQPVAN